MGAPVIHFEIHVKSDEAGWQFYQELFGWSVDANNPMNYGIVNTGGEGVIGGGIAASEQAPFVTVYVQVDDLQAYLDKVEQLGGKTLTPVTEIPDMVTFALFADPDGNRIGLIKAL